MAFHHLVGETGSRFENRNLDRGFEQNLCPALIFSPDVVTIRVVSHHYLYVHIDMSHRGCRIIAKTRCSWQ